MTDNAALAARAEGLSARGGRLDDAPPPTVT